MMTPSRQQLREWSAALTLGPLDPADPKETRYVPLADAGRAAVDELLATIDSLAHNHQHPESAGTAGAGWTGKRRIGAVQQQGVGQQQDTIPFDGELTLAAATALTRAAEHHHLAHQSARPALQCDSHAATQFRAVAEDGGFRVPVQHRPVREIDGDRSTAWPLPGGWAVPR